MTTRVPAKPRTPSPPARRPRSDWSGAHDEALRLGMATIGLQATSAQGQALRAYARLLLKWNRTYNLLGSDEPDAVLDFHLLDSLTVVPVLERWLADDETPLVDVGSGGGLPGIPIAIMRPELPVVLVEPTGKKAAFLRQAAAETGLTQVTVQEARLEDLPVRSILGNRKKESVACAHFICRAFTSLASFARLCAPRSAPGSLVMAMKGGKVENELMELRAAVPQMGVLAVVPLSIPGQSVQRSLVVMRPASRDATGPTITTSGH